MTLHFIVEYIKYIFKRKTRHGVHSPFVYELIENVLKKQNNGIKTKLLLSENDTNFLNKHIKQKYLNIVFNIAEFYNFDSLNLIQVTTNERYLLTPFIILSHKPTEWQIIFEQILKYKKNGDCIIVPNIHFTKQHTNMWNKLCTNNKINLSIDLFGIGLLFFNEDIIEKQHFILQR